MKRPPAFFKVFIAEINDKDLKIPAAFTRCIEQALPEKVYLRDRHNNMWIVKAAKVGDDWYFVDGWVKFAEDNLLMSGDILVFEYICCDSLFNVTLYGPSATEKNLVSPFMLKDIEKEEPVSDAAAADNDDNDDDFDDDDHVDYDEDDDDDDDVDYDEDDEDEDETESEYCDYMFNKRLDDHDEKTENGNYMLMIRHREDKHEEADLEQVNNAGAVIRRDTEQRLINFTAKCYGMEIFQAGLAPQPRNPYFVTKLMKRKCDLFIPVDVIKDHDLDLTQEISLVDPRGREFGAKCKKWKDGRMMISGGWRRLCRVNLVAQDDKCICEFVQGEGRRLFLNISFVCANRHALRLKFEK